MSGYNQTKVNCMYHTKNRIYLTEKMMTRILTAIRENRSISTFYLAKKVACKSNIVGVYCRKLAADMQIRHFKRGILDIWSVF